MTALPNSVRPIRIHATNVIGIGATQLVQSLLPAMERIDGYELTSVYLPSHGALASYVAFADSTVIVRRKRYLPNVVSRVLECTLFAGRFAGDGALLVLGDLPLRCKGRQTVFVQTPLLTRRGKSSRPLGAIIFLIARMVFRLNARFVSGFIVQTQAMKSALAETFPEVAERIHVIAQPAPAWLLASALKRSGVARGSASGLRLFYPAAGYPHKNHRILSGIEMDATQAWPVSTVILTIDEGLLPGLNAPWIKRVGRLSADSVMSVYATVDGLLFLSLSESFGFPLVEAMWIGLPIVCPDLPYARVLCGDEAIYFDPESASSMRTAVNELHRRLLVGWWPDWTEALTAIPDSWTTVARSMLRVTSGIDG
jgi:hypothetical protein